MLVMIFKKKQPNNFHDKNCSISKSWIFRQIAVSVVEQSALWLQKVQFNRGVANYMMKCIFLKAKILKIRDFRPGVPQYMTLTPLSTIY